MDHPAIYKAYKGIVVSISDKLGAFDASGNSVTLDQTKIDAARKILDEEAAKVKYRTDRVGLPVNPEGTVYASIGDQLDMLYKDIVAGTLTTSGTWATHIKAVKDAHPKP